MTINRSIHPFWEGETSLNLNALKGSQMSVPRVLPLLGMSLWTSPLFFLFQSSNQRCDHQQLQRWSSNQHLGSLTSLPREIPHLRQPFHATLSSSSTSWFILWSKHFIMNNCKVLRPISHQAFFITTSQPYTKEPKLPPSSFRNLPSTRKTSAKLTINIVAWQLSQSQSPSPSMIPIIIIVLINSNITVI